MRIIIAGGSGLIGRALTEDFVSDGHNVIVLSRNPTTATGLPAGARAERWDAKTVDGWGGLVEGADAIVNLAGENLAGGGFLPSRWTAERKEQIQNSRLDAGQAIVEAVEAASEKPRVLVQSSAIGFYGPRDDEIITEDSPAGLDFLAQLCVDWEASTEPVEKMGVRRVVIRTGVLLDSDGGALPRLLLPYKLFAGGPFGNGRQYYAWIHAADEVAAIRFLIENDGAHGVYNLTAPSPVTNAAFGKALGQVLNRPSLIPVPGFAMRALLGDVTTIVLDGQRVVPKRLQESGFEFKFPEIEGALRDLVSS